LFDMKKRLLLTTAVILYLGAFLPAQDVTVVSAGNVNTADELEMLLGIPRVSYGQAARFVLEAADAAVLQNPDEAFAYAVERNWYPGKARAEAPVPLSRVSQLIMRSFELKGGIFYSLFKNPRYSYRELVYKKVILGKSDPGQPVSGELLLQIVGRVLYLTEHEAEEKARRIAGAEAERRQVLEAEAERERVAGEINVRLEKMHIEDTRASAGSEGVTISLSNISFEANSARLESSEQYKIQEIAEILKTLPGRKLLIAGHTAQAGTRREQMRTSVQRAQAAADYLVFLGARRPEEITARGYGAERPVADSTTAEGQALNRRVEITILE
jgi:outer membrane protein OmpA-like peptidoglycan-associated protein